ELRERSDLRSALGRHRTAGRKVCVAESLFPHDPSATPERKAHTWCARDMQDGRDIGTDALDELVIADRNSRFWSEARRGRGAVLTRVRRGRESGGGRPVAATIACLLRHDSRGSRIPGHPPIAHSTDNAKAL